MPVEKYRSVEEMPGPERVVDPEERLRRMRALFATLTLVEDDRVRGVQRFSGVEEADAARRARLRDRMTASREPTGAGS